MKAVAIALLAGALLILTAPAAVSAQPGGSWLDRPLVNWNRPGQAVPGAPADAGAFALNDPFCTRAQRPVETWEDVAVAEAGWALFGSYEGGWGVVVVGATAGYDGMCRPIGYHFFVFVDGMFAGTIAPEPMASRTDGGGRVTSLAWGGDALSASYARYTERDPLCCPSATSFVEFRIDRTPAGPVLVPVSVRTERNAG